MSLPNYRNYKDSDAKWVGRIPAHWVVGPLKRMLDIQNGADYKNVESTEGFPVIGSGGPFTFATEYLYDGESVLLGRKGTVDKPLHVTGKFWTVDTMYWSKILPGTWGRFAFYVTLTIPFDYYSTSTALPSMTKSVLGAHLVACPPIDEQTAIAAFLDRETAKIDELIAEQQKLITLLAEKRQATISHAVTKGLNPAAVMKDSGIAWLGDVPAHWSTGALTRIAERVVVGIAEAATHAYREDGVPILRSTNVRAGRLVGDILRIAPEFAKERGSKLISAGDLLTVRTGNAGVTAVIPQELDQCQCFTMLITTLQPGQVSDYFCYWMNSEAATRYFQLEGWGTAQVNISVPILKALPVVIPPFDEQKDIVAFLQAETSKLDELGSAAERAVALLKERRSALITAAVTGQIDVRGAIPQAATESPEAIAA